MFHADITFAAIPYKTLMLKIQFWGLRICDKQALVLKCTLYFPFQLTLRATDGKGDSEDEFSTATVVVNVARDQNPPVFVGDYDREISENLAVNSSVLTVEARDGDRRVCIAPARAGMVWTVYHIIS